MRNTHISSNQLPFSPSLTNIKWLLVIISMICLIVVSNANPLEKTQPTPNNPNPMFPNGIGNAAHGSNTLSFEQNTLIKGYVNFDKPDKIIIYPNPAIEQISMNLPYEVSDAIITLTDLAGRTILLSSDFSGKTVELNIKSMEKGNYQIYVQDTNHFFSGRFIKQ